MVASATEAHQIQYGSCTRQWSSYSNTWPHTYYLPIEILQCNQRNTLYCRLQYCKNRSLWTVRYGQPGIYQYSTPPNSLVHATAPSVNSSMVNSTANSRRLPGVFTHPADGRFAQHSVATAPAPASTPFVSLRASRLACSNIPLDLKLTGKDNKNTFSILERCHTLVTLRSHDNPRLVILDRRVTDF